MDAELKQLKTTDSNLCTAFAESRIGGRSENQDSYGCKETKNWFLVTVCDGMGGGPGGKTASAIAVREIIAGVEVSVENEEWSNLIIKAVRRANMAIISTAAEHPELQGMGSTATVLLLTEENAYVAHVGDSRVYQVRGRKKVFRTFDHSMVFDLVKQKVITEEQARLSAQSNVITRALGIKPDVEVELSVLPYKKGDRFILCTDGIHGTMPESELLRLFANRKNSVGAVTDDVSTSIDNREREQGGGHDNLTLAIVETTRSSNIQSKVLKPSKMICAILAAIVILGVAVLLYCTFKSEDQADDISTLETVVESNDSTQLLSSAVSVQHGDTINKKDTVSIPPKK